MKLSNCRGAVGNLMVLVLGAAVGATAMYGADDPNGAAATVGDPVIVERGANYRIVQTVTSLPQEDGSTLFQTNLYTELANGMNYLDANGQWAETKEEIEIINGLGVARQGPHTVIFNANINVAGGIDLTASDGKRFVSHPMGIAFSDSANGKSAMIAEVKDSDGQVVGANVVVYPDAFTDFNGSLRYTYTALGLEQDVLFYNENFGRPEDYGMDPATTRLEMWTEFFDPPVPNKAVQTLPGNIIDETLLDFGAMQIGRGKAFALERQYINHVLAIL
jgi:hypothetical protein